jgi:hypothetical protein
VGKPFKSTLPVETEQLGWVIVPITGAVGVAAIITTLAVGIEGQPTSLVTVKLYVPAARPVKVLLAPVPATAPGLITQFPAGKPLNTTLPVAIAHVGCVIAPTIGVDGVTGCVLMVKLADASEIQPDPLVTV